MSVNLNLVQGHKYNPDMSLADVKKAVTADIKAAVDAGKLPAEYSYAVRAYREGYRHVEVTVRGMEQGDIYEPDEHGHNRYTAKAIKLRERINDIMAEYNRTNNDSQADYWDQHLWTDVKLEDAQGRAYREQEERLSKERRALRKTLNDLGIFEFKVSTTGHRQGAPCAYTTLSLELAYRRADIEAAGLYVRLGNYTMAVLTGHIA